MPVAAGVGRAAIMPIPALQHRQDLGCARPVQLDQVRSSKLRPVRANSLATADTGPMPIVAG
jgi:hypothetical protein